MLNWLKQAGEKSLQSQADSATIFPSADEIITSFRSQNSVALDAIKSQIIQIFEGDNLALQQKFISQYTPRFSIKAQLIKSLQGSSEWGVAALSANAQDYAYKRPYEIGAVLGDVCYQLANKALSLGQLGVAARYLYFGGQGAQSCVIALKQMGRNQEAITYLNKVIPWLEQHNDTEILPSLYLHRVEANFVLQRYEEADRLLKQIDKQVNQQQLQLPSVDRQTYERLRRSTSAKLIGATLLSSEQLSEPKQVLNSLQVIVNYVEPLLETEPKAQNDFSHLETLLKQLEKHQEHLTAASFALALEESKSMDQLIDLMEGSSNAMTACAIIAPIYAMFTKLLEISQHNEFNT